MANKPTQPDLPQEQLLAAFRDFAEGHFQESRQRWEQQHQQALSDFREMSSAAGSAWRPYRQIRTI